EEHRLPDHHHGNEPGTPAAPQEEHRRHQQREGYEGNRVERGVVEAQLSGEDDAPVDAARRDDEDHQHYCGDARGPGDSPASSRALGRVGESQAGEHYGGEPMAAGPIPGRIEGPNPASFTSGMRFHARRRLKTSTEPANPTTIHARRKIRSGRCRRPKRPASARAVTDAPK